MKTKPEQCQHDLQAGLHLGDDSRAGLENTSDKMVPEAQRHQPSSAFPFISKPQAFVTEVSVHCPHTFWIASGLTSPTWICPLNSGPIPQQNHGTICHLETIFYRPPWSGCSHRWVKLESAHLLASYSCLKIFLKWESFKQGYSLASLSLIKLHYRVRHSVLKRFPEPFLLSAQLPPSETLPGSPRQGQHAWSSAKQGMDTH